MAEPTAPEAPENKRADEVRSERRKQRGATVLSGLKLAVDESKLDRKTWQYRHVNDTPGRIQQMMAEDYDPAPEVANGASVSSVMAGTADGKPYNAVLMRKRRDWYDEDQRERQRPLDEIDADIRRGTAHKKEGALAGVSYTPDGDNNSVSIR